MLQEELDMIDQQTEEERKTRLYFITATVVNVLFASVASCLFGYFTY